MAWLRICALHELADPASGSEFEVEGRIVAVFRIEDQLHAVDGMCAHQGGPIAQGFIDGNCVTCPWHGWQYNVSDGCNLLSGKKMLTTYPVELREGDVWIHIDDVDGP